MRVSYDGRVYRVDVSTGQVKKLDSGIKFTNGIAFGPDRLLYVNETAHRQHLFATDGRTAKSSGPAIFWKCDPAQMLPPGWKGPDGMAFSENGELYVAVFGQKDVTVLGKRGEVITTHCNSREAAHQRCLRTARTKAPAHYGIRVRADGDRRSLQRTACRCGRSCRRRNIESTRMKKLINRPEDVVPELLEGFVLSHPDKVCLAGSNLVARASPRPKAKWAVVTLGGSGHEPGLSGFVGEGMLDVSVAGEIFAAPGAPRCLEAIRLAERGAGVLFIVLNHCRRRSLRQYHDGDGQARGLNVKMILTHEDIAGGTNPDDRRGLVGFLPVYKVAGAAAEQGAVARSVSRDRRADGAQHAHAGRRGARRRRIPRPASRSSSLATTRWKSAWASTAKRAPAA